MILIFLGALALASSSAFAFDPILFKAAGASETEYRARLRAAESLRTPTAAYLAQHPSPRTRDLVINRFARAQKAFLAGDVGAARQHFREVVALVPSEDWSDFERDIFLNSYLRLAQMDDEGAGRDHWLIEAQYLGETLKFDEDLYPPPVVARYRRLRHQIPWFTPHYDADHWPLVLINGMRCRVGACPRVPTPAQTVRVTFVSDEFVPQTYDVDPAKIARVSPARIRFVTGDCAKPELSTSARALGDGRAFFGLSCDSPGPASLVVAPPGPESSALAADAAGRVDLPTAPTPAPARRSTLRSPWLWAGLGAVIVTGLVLATAPRDRGGEAPAPSPAPPAPAAATGPTYGY